MNKKDFKPEDFAKSHPGGTLGKRLLLSARDVMVSGDEMPIIDHDELSKDVIKIISEKGMGVTFVKNKNSKVIGLITDGDLRRALLDNSQIEWGKLKAKDIMTKDPITIDSGELAISAIKKMKNNLLNLLYYVAVALLLASNSIIR